MSEFFNQSYVEVGRPPDSGSGDPEALGTNLHTKNDTSEADNMTDRDQNAILTSINPETEAQYRKYGHMGHKVPAAEFIASSMNNNSNLQSGPIVSENVNAKSYGDDIELSDAETERSSNYNLDVEVNDEVVDVYEREDGFEETREISHDTENAILNISESEPPVILNESAPTANSSTTSGQTRSHSKWSMVRQLTGIEPIIDHVTVSDTPILPLPADRASPEASEVSMPRSSELDVSTGKTDMMRRQQLDSLMPASDGAEVELPATTVSYFNTDSTVEDIFMSVEASRRAHIQDAHARWAREVQRDSPPASLLSQEPSLKASSYSSPLKGDGSSVEDILDNAGRLLEVPLLRPTVSRSNSTASVDEVTLTTLLRNQTAKVAQLELRIVELTDEAIALREERDEQTAQVIALQLEAHKLRAAQLSADKLGARTQQSTAQQTQEELDLMRNQLEDSQFALRGLEERAARLTSDNAAVRVELRGVKVELTSAHMELSELRMQVSSAQQDSATTREQLAAVVTSQKDALAVATRASIEVQVGESKISALEAEKKQLESRATLLDNEVQALKTSLAAVSTAQARKHEEFSQLDRRYSQLEVEYMSAGRSARLELEMLQRENDMLRNHLNDPTLRLPPSQPGGAPVARLRPSPSLPYASQLQVPPPTSMQTITPLGSDHVSTAVGTRSMTMSELQRLSAVDGASIEELPSADTNTVPAMSTTNGAYNRMVPSITQAPVAGTVLDANITAPAPKASDDVRPFNRRMSGGGGSSSAIGESLGSMPLSAPEPLRTSTKVLNSSVHQHHTTSHIFGSPPSKAPVTAANAVSTPANKVIPAIPIPAPTSAMARRAPPQSQMLPQPVDLRRWREEGYPSEYAYAQATGSLQARSIDKPSAPILPPTRTSTPPQASSNPAGVPAVSAIAPTRGRASVPPPGSSTGTGQAGIADASPWATLTTSSELSARFDAIDRNLTALIAEKTSLMDESSKLHQRGGKTLKERSRLAAVELRLKELEKEISNDRRQLAARPQ